MSRGSRTKPKRQVLRNDGFMNAFIVSGIKQYMKNNSSYEEPRLSYEQLLQLWHNRLAQRISALPAESCLKNGYIIKGDEEENNVLQYFDTLHVNAKLVEALTWARHFGRSCIFLLLDDGGTEEEPINYDRLRGIKGLQVYDAHAIQEDVTGYLVNDDITDPNFGNTEWYMLTPPASGRTFYVHHSRLLIFDGDLLPELERIQRSGCSMSCIEGVRRAIVRTDTAQATALNAMERLSTSLTKLHNLADVLATAEGTEIVQRRLEMIDLARNILNTIAVSTDDDYQVFNIPMNGIPEVLDSFGQYLCALTNIPFTLLFGRSPAGLNSTGKGDLENYYGFVNGLQARQLKPQLEKLVKTAMLCKNGPTHGKELKDWTIEFNQLWEPTEKEMAETQKLQAEADKTVADTVMSLMDRQLMDDVGARKYLADKLQMPMATGSLDLDDTIGDPNGGDDGGNE